MSKLVAIGDVHGCFNTLLDLIEKAEINFEEDTVIFLGDYIDRGKYPIETIKYVKELTEKHPEKVIALSGNHEDMCVRYFSENDRAWTWNGYETTYKELKELDQPERNSLLNWMANLEYRCESNNYKFCHSGYWFDEAEDGYSKILWDRNWLYYDLINNDDEKPVIFGHTPHKVPKYYGKNLCIDTGAVFSNVDGFGTLTAAILEPDSITTISIDINDKDRFNDK